VNPHAGHAAANVVAESSKHMRDMKWGNRLALTPVAIVSSLTALPPKQAKLPPPFLWQCLRKLSESCMRTLGREPVTLIVSILHVSHGCGVRATATPAVPLGHSTSGRSTSNFTQLHGSFGALLRGSFSQHSPNLWLPENLWAAGQCMAADTERSIANHYFAGPSQAVMYMFPSICRTALDVCLSHTSSRFLSGLGVL